jgi:hypothetical protein
MPSQCIVFKGKKYKNLRLYLILRYIANKLNAIGGEIISLNFIVKHQFVVNVVVVIGIKTS